MKKVLHESRRRGIDWEQWSSSDMVKNSWTWCVLDDPSTLVVLRRERGRVWSCDGMVGVKMRTRAARDDSEPVPSTNSVTACIRGCVNGVVTFKFRAYGHNPFFMKTGFSQYLIKIQHLTGMPSNNWKGPETVFAKRTDREPKACSSQFIVQRLCRFVVIKTENNNRGQ